jgi:hypothetical protein
MDTSRRRRILRQLLAWLASGLSILAVGSVFVACQLIGHASEITRAEYPTYASYEDDEVKICVTIIQRDRFKIIIVNRTDSLFEIDWMNSYYHNNHGDPEPLMLLRPMGEGRMMARLENTTVRKGETSEYYLYPSATLGYDPGGKGAPTTSHDPGAYRIPYPSADTSVEIPIRMDSMIRTVVVPFEPGVFSEDMPPGCE